VAGALCGSAWLLAARARLRALLADRRAETDARVLAAAVAAADSLGLEQLPLLSRAAALGSPVTFGLLRAEVCLPARVGELGAAELRALFCHEFAHIRRGDAGWLWLGAWLQALFPWQIWLWPWRRRLCAVAELRCDAAASRCTNPVAVAQCLVHVASWLGARRAPAGTLAMAARPSALRTRVEAALADREEARVPAPAGSLLAAGALVLFAAAAPRVRRDAAELPAPGPDPRAGAPADDDARRALRDECALLAAEAERLRRETAGNRDPELRQMLDRLQIKVAAMTRLGGRLMALDERMNHGSNGSRRSR